MSRSYALVTVVNCRLGVHPKRSMTSSGNEVSTFNVAYEDGFGKSSKVIWLGCTAYGTQAKLCNRYLYKGACISISGRLSLQEWRDKDNETRTKMHVTIEHLVFNDKMSSAAKPDGDGITESDINAFDRYEESAGEEDAYSENRRYRNTERDFEEDNGRNGDDNPPPPPFKVPPLP